MAISMPFHWIWNKNNNHKSDVSPSALASVCLPLCPLFCVCASVCKYAYWMDKKGFAFISCCAVARLCPVTRAHTPQQLATRTHRKHWVPLFALRLCTIHIVCYKLLSTQSQPASAGSACFIRQSTECTRNMQLLHSMLQIEYKVEKKFKTKNINAGNKWDRVLGLH